MSSARLPRALVFPALLGALVLIVPLVALLLRTPWSRALELTTSQVVRQALWLSLVTSLSALAVCTLVGVPLAWLLARSRLPGLRFVRALCVLPMVLPPVVAGVALLLAFGRRGVFGAPLAALTGITLPFTTAGVVLAQVFVALPFLVVTVEAGLRATHTRYEEAAATLGASAWTVFRRVSVPLAAPSIVAGMALAWARALGEFGATITFAGSLPGTTQTMPLAVFQQLEVETEVAYLLSALLLGVSIAVLVVLRGRLLGGGVSGG